jgi:hypothetical protein
MGNIKESNKEEKHYTPKVLIDELFNILQRNHKEPITEYMETSAGDGRIIDRFDKPFLAYDIINETERKDITEANYLKTKIPYKKGRVCVQNPPFHKGLRFMYKALEESDYCVSILSSQSINSIDYSKYWVEEIQLYRGFQFEKCKTGIVLVGVRKKGKFDKYDYEQN